MFGVFQSEVKETVVEEVKKEVVKKPITTEVETKKKPVQESKQIVLTKSDLLKILKQRGLK